jgi:hypothetical protein
LSELKRQPIVVPLRRVAFQAFVFAMLPLIFYTLVLVPFRRTSTSALSLDVLEDVALLPDGRIVLVLGLSRQVQVTDGKHAGVVGSMDTLVSPFRIRPIERNGPSAAVIVETLKSKGGSQRFEVPITEELNTAKANVLRIEGVPFFNTIRWQQGTETRTWRIGVHAVIARQPAIGLVWLITSVFLGFTEARRQTIKRMRHSRNNMLT